MACNYRWRHMKQMTESKANDTTVENSDESGNLPEQLNHDEWNPNQIVYRKVCFRWRFFAISSFADTLLLSDGTTSGKDAG
jgi:hypothetical protein